MTGVATSNASDHFGALEQLLAAHPGAGIAACREDGSFTTVPPGLPVAEHPRLEGRTGLDLIVLKSQLDMAQAWDQVLGGDASRVDVQLKDGRAATAFFFDLRADVGVLIMVLVVGQTLGDDEEIPDFVSPEARWCRLEKAGTALITAVEPSFTEMLGWLPEEVVGRRSSELIHPEDQERAVQVWMDLLSHPGEHVRLRCRHLHADGHWMWVDIDNHNRLAEDPPHVVTEMINVSDEMAAHAALAEREELLNRLAEALPLGVATVCDDLTVDYSNDRLRDILGADAGQPFDVQIARMDSEARSELLALIRQVCKGAPGRTIEAQLTGGDGTQICRFDVRAVQQEGSVAALVCVDDITEAAVLRGELEWRATFDDLTKCLNRSAILEALDSAISASPGSNSGTAVVFVDVDEFKQVNDCHGHAAGDAVLREAAGRMASLLREYDLLGRLGGDEFLVVCPRVPSPQVAERIARRLAEGLRFEVPLDTGVLSVHASVGLGWAPDGVANADLIVAMADEAMYEAKQGGGGAAASRLWTDRSDPVPPTLGSPAAGKPAR